MKKYLLLLMMIALCTSAQSAYAQNASTNKPLTLADFKISRKGDLSLSCDQLYQEAKSMSEIINETRTLKEDAAFNSRGVSAAGAVGSLLVGTVTGGIGLALGGLLLDESIENRKKEADKIQDIAEQRRTFIMGIYTAQECEGDIYAMINNNKPAQHTIREPQNLEPASGDLPENPYND